MSTTAWNSQNKIKNLETRLIITVSMKRIFLALATFGQLCFCVGLLRNLVAASVLCLDVCTDSLSQSQNEPAGSIWHAGGFEADGESAIRTWSKVGYREGNTDLSFTVYSAHGCEYRYIS